MRKSLVLGALSLTVLIGLPACGSEDDTGTGEASETGSGDGDGDSTTGDGDEMSDETGMEAGDGDGDSGDGDGDSGDGDGDSGDGDGDGGDGDGDGDVDCTMGWSTLTSTDNDMTTQLDVSSAVLNCNETMTLTATGGSICAADDGNGGYYYTVEEITLTDIIDFDCSGSVLSLTDVSIVGAGNGSDVVVPQAGGDMTGEQPIQIVATISGEALGQTIDPMPLEDFSGVLPEGSASFDGSATTASYSDNSTTVATAAPEVEAPFIGAITINVTLTGLNGSLTFDP